MKKYRFTCGDIIDFLVIADTPYEVFALALTAHPFIQSLGIIYMIEEEGKPPSETIIGDTIAALNSMGYRRKSIDKASPDDIIEYDIVC